MKTNHIPGAAIITHLVRLSVNIGQRIARDESFTKSQLYQAFGISEADAKCVHFWPNTLHNKEVGQKELAVHHRDGATDWPEFIDG